MFKINRNEKEMFFCSCRRCGCKHRLSRKGLVKYLFLTFKQWFHTVQAFVFMACVGILQSGLLTGVYFTFRSMNSFPALYLFKKTTETLCGSPQANKQEVKGASQLQQLFTDWVGGTLQEGAVNFSLPAATATYRVFRIAIMTQLYFLVPVEPAGFPWHQANSPARNSASDWPPCSRGHDA